MFEQLSESLNTTFDKKPEVKETLPLVPSEGGSILPEKEFAKKELKSLIDVCQAMITEQGEGIREGTKASTIMAFSDLVRTTHGLIRELNEIDKTEKELQIKTRALQKIEEPGANSVSVTMTMTGAEMIDRLIEFKKNSQLNDIKPEFRLNDN